MNREWEEVTLSSVSIGNKGSYGIAAPAVEYSKELYTYLRITDITDDGTLNKEGLKSVDDKNAEKYLLKPNDIVFARTGNSTGRSYFYDGKNGDLVYAGFLIKFSLDSKKINPKYMRYYTLSSEYKGWVESFKTGSTRGNINAQTYGNMKIKLPPREQQDFLVKILSTLDEKIEVNNQINKKLEEMGQTIFKHWFVDFEFPDENGEPYKSSGGEMIESELGMIPKGWKVVDISSIFNIKDGTHDSPKAIEEGYHLITSRHLMDTKLDFKNANKISETDYNEVNRRSKVDRYDILISMIGTVGNLYLVQNEEIKFVIKNVGLFKTSEKLEMYEYIYSYLKTPLIKEYINSRMAGSTQQYISLTELRKIPVIIPEESTINLIEEFKRMINPVFNKIYTITNEIEKLEELRDNLLPKLMSGELRVPLEKDKIL